MLDIDGSALSGSGMIVRQAMAYAATTGTAIHVFNVRARRPLPGLRPQHLCAVSAVHALVGGIVDGAHIGSGEFTFRPGGLVPAGTYRFDVGSAGSATALSLAVLPLAATAAAPVVLELVGGTFQDQAPSPFHLEHVLAPLLARMGVDVSVRLVRPGYVPAGGGEIRLHTRPGGGLVPLVAERRGPLRRVWGVALASHLAERRVVSRMAGSARRVLAEAGHGEVHIEEREDTSAQQPGAGLALFADFDDDVRLGADRAGARGRSAERVGARAAHQLLDAVGSGGTLDRFAADQVLVFAALAPGRSRVRLAAVTDHVRTGLWLMDLFGLASWHLDGRLLTVDAGRHPAALSAGRAPVERTGR